MGAFIHMIPDARFLGGVDRPAADVAIAERRMLVFHWHFIGTFVYWRNN
jgi:hypothetical protein